MARIGSKLRSAEGGRVAFMCPGCKMMHHVTVEPGPGPQWSWNGNPDAPTFSPSVLVRWPDPDSPGKYIATCHSFVRDGRIQFLNDCTHALAGQTVDLPDLPTDEA